jgi:hypothetical protein
VTITVRPILRYSPFTAPFLKNDTQKCAFDAVVVSEAVPTPTVSPDD